MDTDRLETGLETGHLFQFINNEHLKTYSKGTVNKNKETYLGPTAGVETLRQGVIKEDSYFQCN